MPFIATVRALQVVEGEKKEPEPVLQPILDSTADLGAVTYGDDFAEDEEERDVMGKGDEEKEIVTYGDDFSEGEEDKVAVEEESPQGASPIVLPPSSVTLNPDSPPTRPTFTASDVNRRVRVHWDEGEFYDGVADLWNPENGHFHVKYDDGDEEWVDPGDEDNVWEWVEGAAEREPERVRPRRLSSYDVVNVEPYSFEGEEYLLDNDTGKIYDGNTKFVGKMGGGGVPDFEAEDSDEDSDEESSEEEGGDGL